MSTHNPQPVRAAIFLSGTGTNAEVLLAARPPHLNWILLVTDAPLTSRARELAARYGLPLAELDIRAFYRDRGLASISLATPEGRRVRELWTAELEKRVMPYRPDLGILAGFLPLTNLTGRFPCLNVHPGDLTVERDGVRILAGLHFRPVERAILENFPALRSSVILAQPYTGSGRAEMDSGPVLGVSGPMPIDLEGFSVEELRAVAAARRPGEPAEDLLRGIARRNLEKLKTAGDHVVFPAAAENFAAGRYRLHPRLEFRTDAGDWLPVRTVEYTRDGAAPVPDR